MDYQLANTTFSDYGYTEEIYGYLPILFEELKSYDAEYIEIAKDTFSQIGLEVPDLNFIEDSNLLSNDTSTTYQESNVDLMFDSVMESDSLSHMQEDVYDNDDDYNDAWSKTNLDNAVPPSYNETDTDTFYDPMENDEEDLPPLAEAMEDVAPSDPISTTDLQLGILHDQAEEDQNLSGGLVQNDHIGVEDANVEGPIELTNENVHPVSMSEESADLPDESNASNNPIQMPQTLEKSDFKGDVGIDSAIQSSLQLSSNEFNNEISPFLPSPVVDSDTGTGVNANLNEQEITNAFNAYQSFVSATNTNFAFLNESYKSVKNVLTEVMSIDNISFMKDYILTNEERINKVSSRIERIKGSNKILATSIVKIIEKDPKGFMVAPMVAVYSISSDMMKALEMMKSNPDDNKPLKYIESFISPNLTFVAASIEKLKIKIEMANERAKNAYSRLINAYQSADSSERDLSKVLKFDHDSSPSLSPFAIRMQQAYNKEISESLMIARKTRSKLLGTTSMSYYNVNKVIDQTAIKQQVKQAIDTFKINTDNIKQKYPKAPFGVKTNSRRLNLLETPVAVKNRKSVPYVNLYQESKIRFS